MNGCCESKSWALSERDLNKFIMKDATMRCVLSRSVASKTDTEGCISFTCIANRRYLAKIRGISKRVFFSLISPQPFVKIFLGENLIRLSRESCGR